MNILVAGGAGFIGSHLCERLICEGNKVYCLDDFSTSTPESIRHLLKNKYFKLIKQDILQPIKKKLSVDQIYNLASPASPIHYQKDPIRTFRVNTEGTKNLLDFALKNKARIMQASTSEVYGDPKVHPQPETYTGSVNSIGIRACYDEGKRGSETLFFDYHRQHAVDIKVVRIFNTYGPRMQKDDGRVIPTFIEQARLNQDLTIYGDGTQTRSFQYVDDLIDGLITAMNTDYLIQPINIGNPEEFSMNQLAHKILELFPTSTSKIVYKPLPSDDPQCRRPDISVAKNLLNWIPVIKLDEGLKKNCRILYRLTKQSMLCLRLNNWYIKKNGVNESYGRH